ncbi:dNA repair protein RecN [Firmicutes bacterium CAG:536]|nr:dNA repair protein RecN [Firmicutes bacterium CAG:536]
MIEQLMVKDYILFDYALVDFTHGMHVITGETGAGKSLLIDAIGYLSGKRINGNIVRKGKDKAILQMVCSTSSPKISQMLEENGFEVEDSILITRTVQANQKSTIRINQQITTLSFVRELVSYMIDMHSQMDTYQLMQPSVQLDLLDALAQTKDLREEVAQQYTTLKAIEKEYHTCKNESLSDDELDYLTAQLNRIDELNIQEGELESLQEKVKICAEMEKNTELFSQSIYQLNKENGLMDTCYDLSKELSKTNSTSEIANQLMDIYYRFDEIKENLQEQLNQFDQSSESIDEMESRIYTIKAMYKRYGGSFSSLMEAKANLEKKIERFLSREHILAEMETNLSKARKAYDRLAEELSQKRKAIFSSVEQQVNQHCHDLMLEHADFHISSQEKEASKDGKDAIEFLISMNPGQPLVPLKDSASGGELSRLMLALKVVFQAQQGVDTIIFDEIDTGVSGKVAFAMGHKMHTLAQHYQVLCITHLASVACFGDRHYCVQKTSEDGSTQTSIHLLNEKATLEELAVMSSGQVNQASLQAAQELKDRAIHG